MTAAHSPLTMPAERSISPSTSTRKTLIASVPSAAICSIKLVKLRGDKNLSFANQKINQMPHNPSTIGTDPQSAVSTRCRSPWVLALALGRERSDVSALTRPTFFIQGLPRDHVFD